MITYKTFKFQIYPNNAQEEFLNRQFEAVRFCFNKTIGIWKHFYETKGKKLSVPHEIEPLLSAALKSRKYKWLKDYDCQALKEAVRLADKSIEAFISGRKTFPKFKSPQGNQISFHHQKILIKDEHIRLPKLGWIEMDQLCQVKDPIQGFILYKDCCGDYFVKLLIKIEYINPIFFRKVSEDDVLGIHFRYGDSAVCSDGTRFPIPESLELALKKLRKTYKDYLRIEEGSENKEKAYQCFWEAYGEAMRTRIAFLEDVAQSLANLYLIENNYKELHFQFTNSEEVRMDNILDDLERKIPIPRSCPVCEFDAEKLELKKMSWQCPRCQTVIDGELVCATKLKQEGIDRLTGKITLPQAGCCP